MGGGGSVHEKLPKEAVGGVRQEEEGKVEENLQPQKTLPGAGRGRRSVRRV